MRQGIHRIQEQGTLQLENGEGGAGLTAMTRYWGREKWSAAEERDDLKWLFGEIKHSTNLFNYWEKQLILGTDKTKQIREPRGRENRENS